MDIEEFADWLFTAGKAAKIIESYLNDVKRFQSYMRDKLGDVRILSRCSFVRYKEHMMKEGYAVSTINKKINKSLQRYSKNQRNHRRINHSVKTG